MSNQYRYIADVHGGKSGKPFGVWWFCIDPCARGHYEVKASSGNNYRNGFVTAGYATDEQQAIDKAKKDVEDM